MMAIKKEYSDLVYRQNELSNKKHRSIEETLEIDSNGRILTDMELRMSSADIIESIRESFKHIPERT